VRTSRHRRQGFVLAATLLVVGLVPASTARAGSVIAVDNQSTALGGAGCSLPEAILAANQDAETVVFDPGPPFPRANVSTGCTAGAGDDVIMLEPGVYSYVSPISDPGSHLGPAALPMIKSVITIEGVGAVLQRSSTANDDFRLFSVGPNGNLDLREVYVLGFTAKGGNGTDGGGGGMGAGGAILVDDGALRVQWSTFKGNVATGGNGGHVFSPGGGGGGGGGIGGNASSGSLGGGGGGGSRGSGGTSLAQSGAGGGGTLLDGGFAGDTNPFVGGYLCGGAGNDVLDDGSPNGFDGCAGGGGGGGSDGIILTGDGGSGGFGGGGGGGARPDGRGGDGGFGGGGGSAGTAAADDGGDGGDGGFGGGGGAGPGGAVFGEPGDGGTFAGDASDLEGGGGAGLGGAIFGYRANIIVSNSTFTGNAAARGVAGGPDARNGADAGGAIFAVGGSTTVVNTTIAGNQSTGDGAGLTVYRPTTGESASLRLVNSIVAGNTGRDECFVLNGVTSSGTNNLVTPHPTDVRTVCPGITQSADAELGALVMNAPGRTPTMALSATSPAVDAADPAGAPLDDQRGVLRPQGPAPDIGAFELDGVPPPPIDGTAPTASPTASPAANRAGWNISDVTVSWRWADDVGGSGIDGTHCTATTMSSGEGAAMSLTATCRDLAGNTGSASYAVSVDKAPPTVTCAATPSYTIGGDHATDVTATVTDALSGAASSPLSADVTASDVAAAGVKSKTLTGSDVAGNQTTVDCPYVVRYAFLGFLEPVPQASYKRGSTIPLKFRLGSASGAPLADADAASLVASCLVEVTLDGAVQGCAGYVPTSDTFKFDVKIPKNVAPGSHTIGIRVSATGGVVNEATTTITLKK
jgi:hypothetical protein